MFINEIFDLNLSKTATYSTSFLTKINSTQLNFENRRNIQNQARYKYNIPSQIISIEKYQSLIQFFNTAQGMFASFKFFDFLDHKIDNQIVELEKDKIYIYKEYKNGDVVLRRKIHLINENTLQIFVNDVKIENFIFNDSDCSISFPFVLTENDTIQISCDFYARVRFNNDDLISSFLTNNKVKIESFELISC